MLIELVGLGTGPPDPVAAAVGRRAAAPLPGPGPGRAGPRCSSSTSPPPASTPRAASRSATIIAAQRDRGICVILTTHELAEAERLADQVVIIDRGRMLAEGTPAALASGSADGSIRFTTAPDIDTAALVEALTARSAGPPLDEERPGSYRLAPAGRRTPHPAVIATLAGWLAERDLALGDLRTGQSLEEAYLAITGSRGTSIAGRRGPEPAVDRG